MRRRFATAERIALAACFPKAYRLLDARPVARSRIAAPASNRRRSGMSNTASDRSRVSASDPSEVRYFGKKHGLTDEQVLDLIKEHGNDRNTLEAAVARTRVE
jgi:hypothetical protein